MLSSSDNQHVLTVPGSINEQAIDRILYILVLYLS
jgi:hypothetical protein